MARETYVLSSEVWERRKAFSIRARTCSPVCAVLSCSVVSDSLWLHALYPARLLCPWGFSGKNTGVSRHALFRRISPTQGLNPGLLRCWRILYRLSHQGSSCSPIPGGLFLPLVEKHQTMNVLWECIFFINRSIITVDAVYKITCQGHFISPL